tara:strand:+ start:110700 stop:113363 length:2664 start_codon:yes stop_codon:yes gene_type:complete
MESQNNKNIDNYFKKISEETQPENFQGMENIWNRVEKKLDKKEKKQAFPLWKYAGIAASIIILVGVGSLFIKNDSSNIIQSPENNIVTIEEDSIKEDIDTPVEDHQIVFEDINQKEENNENKVATEIRKNEDTAKESFNTGTAVSEIESESISESIVLEEESDQNLNTVIAEKGAENIDSGKTISGTVTDDTGLPLPGVNVLVKNTSTGTQTDFDGKYNINVYAGQTLVFSYVGFETKEKVVTTSTTIIDVEMEAGEELNQVVVTAHSVKREKKALGYAVSEVSSERLNRSSREELPKALSGKTSGVIISNEENEQGSYTQINIRGYLSVDNNHKLLYVLDGKPITQEELQKVNSKKIKNISLLKGFAAAKAYGRMGRNGVVVLETKNQKNNTEKTIGDSISFENILKLYPPLDQQSYDKDNESYESFIENPFEGASYNPVSTFSIDVDNASYTNIRRFINNGQFVPKDAVRIEEMINFFKYDYPQPKSKHPFTINTEYSDAPWNSNHKLLRIGLQGKEIPTDILPKSNFVFLVDVSGSMSAANKLPLLKGSMKILLDELREDDMVSIVYYANNVGVLLKPTKASQKERIAEVIDGLHASGGTSGGAGIELAYEMAEKNFIKGGNNRIILATDGDFNIGKSSDKEMLKLIEEKRKSGVYLTCLGYGMGNYKDSKMEILADKGNGNYAYIDNIQEANRFLGKEFKGSMFTIAKDVKIQIEFNPNHVQAYRLIGYENRKLRNEDFTNDAIDAGELGSGHTVTALYEIIPVGVKSKFYENDQDLKYTQNTSKSNEFADELATVKFRYKKPDEKKSIEMVHPISKTPVNHSKASKDFKFASAVAWFGLKLRDSELVTNKDSKEILKLAREGINNDTDGYKAEFIRLVESVK